MKPTTAMLMTTKMMKTSDHQDNAYDLELLKLRLGGLKLFDSVSCKMRAGFLELAYELGNPFSCFAWFLLLECLLLVDRVPIFEKIAML